MTELKDQAGRATSSGTEAPRDILAADAAAPILVAEAAAPALSAVKSQTYLRLVWRRFRRNTMGMIGAVCVGLLVLGTVFADFLAPYDPTQRDRDAINEPPQALHFLAADGFSLIPYTNPLSTQMDPSTFGSLERDRAAAWSCHQPCQRKR